MALGIALTILALIGIIYGRANKRKTLVIASATVLIIVAAPLIYFDI